MRFIDKTTFKLIKNRIIQLIKNTLKRNFVYPHLCYTEKWIIKLNPNTNFALRLAALLHDIDRAFMKKRTKNKNLEDYKNYKSKHAKKSYRIAKKILGQLNFSKSLKQKILFLIRYHEHRVKSLKCTYHKDLNVLIDADALAFFEELNEYYKTWGKKATEDKIAYTWARLSNKGKCIAKKRFFKRLKKFGLKVPDKV